ncbi:hypothetical protein ACKI1H_20775 [Pseudomonas sp. YH-1]|uniref:hypothetical protein n=1 Tax=Pseudomonas sp. YH-1 TaxID=3384787 RepID=UPI003F817BDE
MAPVTSSSKLEFRIQRTFRDLSQEDVADHERALILARMGWAGAIGWDKLLESRRVLIISEAGAGKTYECRAQQQALWDAGDAAFYLELAQLSTQNLRDLLSADEEARLDEWLAAQSDIATFFLDSIDELKLTLGSFETALKRLSKAIAGQLSRVRIIITTRPIAVDQQLIQQHLPVPEPLELIASGDSFADIAIGRQRKSSGQREKEAAPVWRNVALMPLSDEQIREMATIEGIDDADALLSDIRTRNAEDFARRPQDLIELCTDWREHRRVRTHFDQVANNIRVKLKPRTDRQEPAQLSPDKAFEGASRLALASLLTRKLTIRLSVEADRSGEPGTVLDPALVLHDWTPKERETLLERALFGFASYGRIRFHHRSVIEFLAAQCLKVRLGQGMPIKAVKRLLFAELPQGVRVMRPTMRPVAAWLAASQPSIFSEIRDHEPEVLLDHADPESLPLPLRVDALQFYVQRYGQGGWRGLHVPRVQVHRFASQDLEDHVQNLWQTGIENHEVRELLLQLIGAGQMSTCADIAHRVAIDITATHGERLDAIEALVELNDQRLESLTMAMADTPALWPDTLVRGAIIRLFPHHIAPEQFCRILKRIQETENTIDELRWMLPRNIIAEPRFAPGYLEALRTGLTDLITNGLVWKKEWPHLVSCCSHLIPILAAVCLRLIYGREMEAAILRSTVIALRLEHENHGRDDPVQSLRSTLANLSSQLREEIFWADDAFSQGLHLEDDPWRRLHQASFNGPLNLNGAQDGIWVQRTLADIDRPLPERTMMLYASLHGIRDDTGDPRNHIEGLKQFVADQPELVNLLERHLAPPSVDPEAAKLNARIEQQRKASEKREAKRHKDWVKFWQEVADHPKTAFGPDHEGSTTWNLWQVMQLSGNESRSSGWDRRFIEKYFGKEIADQLRISMRSIWRNDRPTLRYERPADKRGTFLIRWQLGLAAIAAEAEDPDWACKLSVEEAELAARYAPIESSGFPTWLEALAREHSVSVERTLGPDLTAELEEIAAPRTFAIMLQNISHAPATVAQLFLPRLRAWLDAHTCSLRDNEDELTAAGRLERVLKILLEHVDDGTTNHVCLMAEDRLKISTPNAFTQTWLTTLMRCDPAKGSEALERLLAPFEPAETGTAIDVFGTLFGDRHNSLRVDLTRPSFTPQLLLRLARLAYRYVRPCDDIVHEGVFSPGSRDAAQEGRNAVLSALLGASGSEAWAVKLEMTADPLFAHFRDRLAMLAREKEAEGADNAVFTELELDQFSRYGELPPTTRDDMFAVLVDRLDDLEDLLLQDVSPRDAWALIKDEKVMRREISRALQHASNHVYQVDQEAVTADEKETDIRLRSLSGQQGTIELKLGENWSGRELRDTIKCQLVTKYMAAESSRSGCLLVTVASDRKWDHPDTAERIDIKGLKTMLETEASRVANDVSDCIRLTVKVLDLRPRLSSSRIGKP